MVDAGVHSPNPTKTRFVNHVKRKIMHPFADSIHCNLFLRDSNKLMIHPCKETS